MTLLQNENVYAFQAVSRPAVFGSALSLDEALKAKLLQCHLILQKSLQGGKASCNYDLLPFLRQGAFRWDPTPASCCSKIFDSISKSSSSYFSYQNTLENPRKSATSVKC